MGIVSTPLFIWRHPLSKGQRMGRLLRFVKWQIGSRLVLGPVAARFVNDARLFVQKGMTGATGNLYVGLHEFEDMSFVLHGLRPDDLFVDIGANVGSYTVLAGAAVGASCVSFEPIPETFGGLLANIHLNAIAHRVEARNIGLGEAEGTLRFTKNWDTTNHVVLADEGRGTIEVPVQSLDQALGNRRPALIKIDVEGFESPVIAGGNEVLESEGLLGVLMELNGSGRRYGFDEQRLHERMLDHRFRPFRYSPFERSLVPLDKNNQAGNTLYLRNLDEMEERLKTAPAFWVDGHSI
jgi:FkbM family methyltransferase